MAQLDTSEARARLRLRIRQRPGLVVVAVACASLVVAAAAFGVISAGNEGVSYLEAEETAENLADASEQVADSSDGQAAGEDEKSAAQVYVDVGGAVNQPGLIVLQEGARVNDAVREAGGFAEGADTSGINLAALLTDGEKLYVPTEGEAAPVSSSAGVQGGGAASNGLVNINTASADELDELPGVGPSTAQAIIDDREQNGEFTSVEDIMRVSGIGEKKFEKLESSICV